MPMLLSFHVISSALLAFVYLKLQWKCVASPKLILSPQRQQEVIRHHRLTISLLFMCVLGSNK